MPSLLAGALEIAESGRRVFPLKPSSKVPAIRAWPEKATTDPDSIRRWWHIWPDANIGLPCGARLAVVDIDTKHHGAIQSWMPSTLTASTPTGGLHLYYAVNIAVPNSVSRIAPGVDVRGERGYVVAPPSVLPNGRYAWLPGIDEPHPLPDDLAELLIPEDQRYESTSIRRKFQFEDYVEVGRRNDYLTRLCGHLMAQGIDDTEAYIELRNEADRLSFTPRPDEISKIVRSIRRYH
jgi:hypothetical protein